MKPQIDTQLIHAGEPQPRIGGAVSMPVFQSAMYEYSGAEDEALRYIRYNNSPNHEALQEKLAALEQTEAALVTASGMAAISTALLTVLSPGNHLLVQEGLYGGTHSFVTRHLPKLGIEVDFMDAADPDSWPPLLRPTTRAVYVEAISNPLMQVGDLEAVATFARAHDLVSMIDSTFATPVNFRPAEWGFDVVLHSATKYLNGHSDLVAGVIAGQTDVVDRMRDTLTHFGGSLDPHACVLLHRGLKTLALRMRRHNENALRLAQFLDEHPLVATVNYSGLKGNAQHARAEALFDGFGGMLSFEVEGERDTADQLLEHLTLPVVAPSLGGVETLITRPAITSHASLDPADRQRLGITDGLLRISVGIEAADDLVADFEQALTSMEVVAS